LLFLLLLPFVFYVVNESRLEVFPMVVRINTSGFLDVLLVLYLLEEPKIDVAILSPEGAQDGWMDGSME
jgi:hypothetical protein